MINQIRLILADLLIEMALFVAPKNQDGKALADAIIGYVEKTIGRDL